MSLADQQWCPTSVQVTALQARGLRVKGKSGTNDAYAVLQVGKEKFQTSVVEKSVTPVWKEEATFDLPQQLRGGGGSERTTLQVQVLHRALVGPDKLLGQAVINLPQLSEDTTRNKTEWFRLLDKHGKPDKDRGEVLLDIQFMRNNMTASMFDLSAAGKSRSRLGKFKDKVRGKKKELDSSPGVVPSLTQVMTDSEEEANGDGEEATKKDGKSKKLKVKSLFSSKTNLQKTMSQSMSVLPVKNSSLSGSQSSGLNMDPPEGKKKFKFKIHKRSGSSDSKDLSLGNQKRPSVEQNNMCINGSHIYCEEPQPRTSRAGSNFSLASSGHGSMEDVPDNSSPSLDSLRAVRQYSPWMEEEEEEEEDEEKGDNNQEIENKQSREDVANMEKERRKKEEEEILKRQEELKRIVQRKEETQAEEEKIKEEELQKLAKEKRLKEQQKKKFEEEEKRREEEKIKKEEERKAHEEEERRLEEERRREEELKLAEKMRIEEEKRIEELRRQKEEEERIEEMQRKEEEDMARRQKELEEMRRAEQVKVEREQEERRRKEEEEILRRQEEERRRKDEEMQKEYERKKREEEMKKKEEEERARKQKEAEEMKRDHEERRRKEEEEEMLRRQELERELEKERLRLEEEERKAEEERLERENEEKIRLEEEIQRKEEERRQTEEKMRKEEERRLKELERLRQEEEERMRQEELENRRIKEKRRQEDEAERARKEMEENERLAQLRRLEEQKKRQIEEEEKFRKDKLREEEEEERKLKEEKLANERRASELISTNPFEEDFSQGPFEEKPNVSSKAQSHTVKGETVKQRCDPALVSSDEMDPIGNPREKRKAPQRPESDQEGKQRQKAQDVAELQMNKQNPDSDAKTVNLVSQSSTTIPLQNKSPTNTQSFTPTSEVITAKNSKRPAPSRPQPVAKDSSELKTIKSARNIPQMGATAKEQVQPITCSNPFEDEDELSDQEDSSASDPVCWPPGSTQTSDRDAASQVKLKSSKMARAPAPPAKSDASGGENIVNKGLNDANDLQQESTGHLHVSKGPNQDSRHIKTSEKPPSSRRLLPVKPLNPSDQPSTSLFQEDTKSPGDGCELQTKYKVPDTVVTGPFSQLTREELISLVLKQESQLLEKQGKISELEQYIDNLLVRVIEEQPSILMSLSAVPKKVA